MPMEETSLILTASSGAGENAGNPWGEGAVGEADGGSIVSSILGQSIEIQNVHLPGRKKRLV